MISDIVHEIFDQVYIINLPERTDRRNEISDQLEKVGLSLDDPIIQVFPAVRPDDKGPFPSIGARGCFMSHLGVLEHAVTAGHNSILILEDDMDWTSVALAPDNAQLSTLLETDWDYVHGGLGTDRQNGDASLGLERLTPDQGVMLSHFVAIRGEAVAKAHSYLSAMLGRPEGSPEGGPMHVDGAYGWFRNDNPQVKGYICVPSLARQRPSQSDVTPSSGLKALPGISHALALVRYVRKKV
jgi:hypothetical protein